MNSKIILIIEDDSFLRSLLAKKLKEENYQVIEAIDGENGLQILKEKTPDLIVLDLLLPGTDGFEVLKKIKENPQLAFIPLIILSNLAQKEEVERGLKLGADDYLIKSQFTPEEIIVKVKEALQKTKNLSFESTE